MTKNEEIVLYSCAIYTLNQARISTLSLSEERRKTKKSNLLLRPVFSVFKISKLFQFQPDLIFSYSDFRVQNSSNPSLTQNAIDPYIELLGRSKFLFYEFLSVNATTSWTLNRLQILSAKYIQIHLCLKTA